MIEKYLRDRYSAEWDSESPVKIFNFTRRIDLPRLFKFLNYRKGAEIGVYKGKNAQFICSRNPRLKLLCIDPYRFYTKHCNRWWTNHQVNYDKAMVRLARYQVTFLKELSMDAVKTIPVESLDFVYIDGNHLCEYVLEDITEWNKRVKAGGIISGHDYFNGRNCEVIKAVDEYVKKNNIKRWFLTSDFVPSFFWVK